MKLSEISINRPVLACMMSLGLVVFGIIGLGRLPVRELPDVDPPIVNVQTIYRGASAAVMETQITEPLEDALMSVEGIRTLTSESREQVSSITIEFNLSRDIEVVAQDVRDRVSRVRGRLPDDIEEPIVAKQDADASPVLWIALFSDRYSTLELSTMAENLFKDRLQTVNGVSSVIFGGQKRFAIRLWLDASKMAARGVTVLDVEKALKRENVELPSGLVENWQRSLSIQTYGQMKNPDEYNRMVIKRDGDTLTRLGDIGNAMIGVEDERSIARFNSKPAVGIGVIKQSKANTIEVVKQIKAEVARIMPSLPEGVKTSFPYDESIYVEKSIVEVWETLLIAFLLVVITIFLFLYNFRSTFIPAITIPVSIISTFGVLYAFGYSINIVTMLGFVLAIGLVVDDAIIVLENIYRHIEAGMKPFDAAVQGMKEIGFVVIATTVALVAVFLPMAFQTSVTGRLFIEFAVAICFSVIISAFVALTLAPMLAARILKPIDHSRRQSGFIAALDGFFKNLTINYGHALNWSLRHTTAIGVVCLASIALIVFFYVKLDHEFVPLEDKGRFLVMAITPEGSTKEYTDRMVQKMEKIVAQTPETKEYFSAVALARGGTPGNPAQGLAFIRLKEDPHRRNLRDIIGGMKGLGAQFFSQIQGAFVIPIIPRSFGGGFTQPFQLVIQSQDLVALNNYAEAMTNKLRALGFLMNVRSTFELNKPQLDLNIDRDRAAVLGVTVEDIAKTLQIAFGGSDLSRVNINGKEYKVIVQLDRTERLTPTDLDKLYVNSSSGQLVQLSNLLTHNTSAGPSAINHHNRLRSAVIEATPMGVPLGAVMDKVGALLKTDLPDGFTYEWKGDAKELIDSSKGIYFILILAAIIIYMVLASQFESLIHPITVMVTLPMAALGAFGGLWLMSLFKVPSMGVNLYSQIGLILLFGLVTKNAILLVEFANQQMAKGKTAIEAMQIAGAIRLRPILMTAAATIAGILPIAIGFGASGEARRPLGVAAVSGMAVSTFLTLFIIPVVYVFFSKLVTRKVVKLPTTLVVIAISSLLVFNGCTVGKDFQRPSIHMPKAWKEAVEADSKALGKSWWEVFGDDQLNTFEQQALANNQDIQGALAKVEKARALARLGKASFLPRAGINAEASREKFSANVTTAARKLTQNKFSVPLDFSYELDIFGKIRRAYEAGVNEALASDAMYQTVRLTLTAEVAQNYFLLRQMDEEIGILNQAVNLRERIADILVTRGQAGLTAQLDVSRGKTELARAQTQVIEAKRKRAQYENALSLLCGQNASDFKVAIQAGVLLPPTIPTGLPSDLLKRRSDIIEAEALLAAANAKVGVAQGALFPSITLTGSAGFSSLQANSLFNWESRTASLGPSLTLPFFDGGRNKAKLAAARADYAKSVADYKGRVLTALSEMENALANVRLRQEEYEAQQRLLDSAAKTFELSQGRYKEGLVSYLEVVDSQRSHLEAQIDINDIQTQRLVAAVLLVKALGGSW